MPHHRAEGDERKRAAQIFNKLMDEESFAVLHDLWANLSWYLATSVFFRWMTW
jgi:hypothetical protein